MNKTHSHPNCNSLRRFICIYICNFRKSHLKNLHTNWMYIKIEISNTLLNWYWVANWIIDIYDIIHTVFRLKQLKFYYVIIAFTLDFSALKYTTLFKHKRMEMIVYYYRGVKNLARLFPRFTILLSRTLEVLNFMKYLFLRMYDHNMRDYFINPNFSLLIPIRSSCCNLILNASWISLPISTPIIIASESVSLWKHPAPIFRTVVTFPVNSQLVQLWIFFKQKTKCIPLHFGIVDLESIYSRFKLRLFP